MQRGYFEIKNVPNINPESILNDVATTQNNIEMDGVTQTLGTGPDSIKIIKNFVDKEELELLKKLCDFNYKNIQFNQIKETNLIITKYKEKIKNTAENIFGFKLEHDDLANEINLKTNYLNGRKPNFATDVHTDTLTDYACEVVFDYQVRTNKKWDLLIEGKKIELLDNDAVCFEGEKEAHWREKTLFNDDEFVEMICFNCIGDGHWRHTMDVNPKNEIEQAKQIQQVFKDWSYIYNG